MALVLPEPNFIDRNPAEILAEIVADYEQRTGKTLYPAQPEMLMILVLVYREVLLRENFNEAAKQNLIQYATGAILDHHALLFAVERQDALRAKTILRFTADNEARESTGTVITIPTGTQVRTKDSKHSFVTLADLILEMTDTYKDVEAEALDAGAAANGYPAGTVTELLTTIAFLEKVENTTLTAGGADIESDDQLRQRVMEAPESFSVAGSRKAYRFWAFSAHPSIIDVAVDSNLPGTVQVYPLTSSGIPNEEILQTVQDILSDERVRPLTDTVTVLAPTRKTFTIEAQVTLYSVAPSIETRAAIETKLADNTATLRKKLGRDIVPNQLISLIQSVSGVYNVQLVQPASLQAVAQNEFADCTDITVTLLPATNEQPLTT